MKAQQHKDARADFAMWPTYSSPACKMASTCRYILSTQGGMVLCSLASRCASRRVMCVGPSAGCARLSVLRAWVQVAAETLTDGLYVQLK
jgi:hypothetical protein